MKLSRFIQTCIHRWLNATGARVDPEAHPYLLGPRGTADTIGEGFYQQLAEKENLRIEHSQKGGLLPHFQEVLDPTSQHLEQLDHEIPIFYEQTARYKLEVWSQMIPPVSWFAKLLIRLVSTEMKQLNIPLDSLETSYGMSSAIIHLSPEGEAPKYVCWLRKSNKSNKVVYAGFYSAFPLGNLPYQHVRVVFPLPKGNVTVLLRVELLQDGSVRLVSDSRKYRGTGYYRVHTNRQGVLKFRKIPIHETIHVFRDSEGTLRTDHDFRWWSFVFLRLHYKIIER